MTEWFLTYQGVRTYRAREAAGDGESDFSGPEKGRNRQGKDMRQWKYSTRVHGS